MMKNKNGKELGGVIVPLVTPLNRRGRIDLNELRRNVRRLISAKVDALFAGGSAGLGPLLTDPQWRKAMEAVVEAADGKIPLVGGAIDTSTERILKKIRILDKMGFDYLCVTSPYYIILRRPDEFRTHFKACSNETRRDIIVYNIPQCTGSAIPTTVILELADQGYVHYCKESSGDRKYFKALLNGCHSTDFRLFMGSEENIEWGLKAGAAGIVPVCANLAPQVFTKAVAASAAKNWKGLKKIQEKINRLRDALILGDKNWVSGLLYGMSLAGVGSGKNAMPFSLPPCEEQEKIRLLLSEDWNAWETLVTHVDSSFSVRA